MNAPLRNEGSRDGVGTLTWDGSREMIDCVGRGGEPFRGVSRSSMLLSAGCPIGRQLDAAREVLYLSTAVPVGFVDAGSQGSRQGHAIEKTWLLACDVMMRGREERQEILEIQRQQEQ